ncbi:oxidoreductase nitrogenase component 1 [Spirochaetia bacterium]|nr:oxidoreductase nitrogenase component 1 [Spirochaetia bacterium]
MNGDITRSAIERPRYFCSFGGALGTLEALPETIPIMHATSGCAASIAWGQAGTAAMQVGGFCGGLSVPSSNIGEREVIFGGADRLTEQIRRTFEVMEGRLFVVITSCVTEIIGDDVQAVVSEIRGEMGASPDAPHLVFAKTGGFRGNSYLGYDIVMEAIVRQFVQKPVKKRPLSVNLLGIVPYMDIFWRGNLAGLRRALELLGLEVNSFFTAEDSLDGIQNSAEAELTIVVSDIYGIETARVYKELYDVPYIQTSLPIGPTATAGLLREVVKALGLTIDVEAIIEQENYRYYAQLAPIVDAYFDGDHQRYAVIVADTNYAVALTRFLTDDLGWIPALVQCTEVLDENEKEQIIQKLRNKNPRINPRIVFDSAASETGRYISEMYPRRDTDLYVETLSPAFVFGSALERATALKIGAPHLSVSFPVANRCVINRGYTGFDGALTLIEDTLSAVTASR